MLSEHDKFNILKTQFIEMQHRERNIWNGGLYIYMKLHDSTFIDAYMFHKILDLCKGWLALEKDGLQNISVKTKI